MLSDQIVSLIRTYVPVAVGAFLTWLASALEVGVFDQEVSTGLTVGLAGVIIALYYALVRVLERKWPVFGLLLGSRKQPMYAGTKPERSIDV